jgi:hypothetical protein
MASQLGDWSFPMRTSISDFEDPGAVWFRGYPLGDEDIPNQLVRGSHFSCLVVLVRMWLGIAIEVFG